MLQLCTAIQYAARGGSQRLERRLERTERALETNMDRLHIMDEHLKNVQQELKYTQTRVREQPGPGLVGQGCRIRGGRGQEEGYAPAAGVCAGHPPALTCLTPAAGFLADWGCF